MSGCLSYTIFLNFNNTVKRLKVKNKMRFTLKINNPYTPNDGYWSFVKKIKGGYEQVTQPASCKDYIHEGIANKLYGMAMISCTGVSADTEVNMDKFQIAMYFNAIRPDFKKNLYSIKKYINALEKKHGIPQTAIVEVGCPWKSIKAFVITSPKEYIESPALYHGLVAMLRTLHYAGQNITKSNISKLLNKQETRRKDYKVLSFVIKYDIFGILMRNHAHIMKGLTLKDIYPKTGKGNRSSNYHGGYGMVAVCRRSMYSKPYHERVTKLLEEAKVPSYFN